MKLIDHPNIIKLYDVWETSTELYLILEYVEGGELFDHLCAKGRLGTEEALGYFQQIIHAIDYCHRFNIAHRDLKPENLLLDTDMNIKVADFGFATWQTDSSASLLKTACGSPHYAAPELIKGEAYNGASADIWSCGVILYALLAGRLPFDDEDPITLLRKVRDGAFEIPTTIHPLAKDLIRKMLEKDVTKRVTIPEILSHPFYLLQEPKILPGPKIPDLETLSVPLSSKSKIDMDVLKNLCTLWNGISQKEIVKSLKSPDVNWQKVVYHLLVRYRTKHLEDYDEEEERKYQAKRAARKKQKYATRTDLSPLKEGSANEETPNPDQNIDSPSVASPSPVASPQSTLLSPLPISQMLVSLNIPPLQIPPSERGDMTQYLEELGTLLAVLQASITPHLNDGSTSPQTPVDLGPYEPRVVEYGQDVQRSYELLDLSFGHPDGSSPLAENGNWNYQIRNTVSDSNQIGPKSSLKKYSTAIDTRRSLRVQIKDPMDTPRARPHHPGSPSPYLPGPSPAISDGSSSFIFPSENPKRRSWFGTVFKFATKPANLMNTNKKFVLLSVHDAYTSQEECRRLLIGLGIRVDTVTTAGRTRIDTLRCRLGEIKDLSGKIAVMKAMRFKVEMHNPSILQQQAGFEASLHLIHEKGSAETFQTVFKRLQESWELDGPSDTRSAEEYSLGLTGDDYVQEYGSPSCSPAFTKEGHLVR